MRSLVIILFSFSGINLYAQPDDKYIRKGNGNYRDGDYKQAELEYRKALELDPESYRADYNLGNSLYKQNQYDAAASRYSSLLHSNINTGDAGEVEKNKNKEITLSRYYYNLGNALYNSQKFKESVEAYKMSLRNYPHDLDAKHNLQLALKQLKEQEQQQQQNKEGGNNSDKKQEQNKDDQQNKQSENSDQNKDRNADSQEQEQESRFAEITPEDAERILQALENEEKKTMRQVQERQERIKKEQVEKNW